MGDTMKVDLPDGEWAELDVPKHLRQSDVIEIVEYAEEHGIDLESGKYSLRAQMGLTNILLTRYVTDWSYIEDGERRPITMATFQDMDLPTFRALAGAVGPLLKALAGDLTEPDPLSAAGSSSTEPAS